MSFTSEQLKVLLEQTAIRADHEFKAPPVCLEIEGNFGNQIFSTLGNFSTTLARPKAGKTTFAAIPIIALLNGRNYSKFIPSNPGSNKKILWIDTEQGKSDSVKTIRFISKKVTGDEKKHPENLYYLSLRPYNSEQRIQITEFAINTLKDLFFVVIDGVRDFVGSINDEREATKVADYLLKWSQEKNIHIFTILHVNKGDNNARGHLGTELMNKAETVAKLTRDDNHGTRSTIVESEFSRNKDFEPFAYSIDGNGNLTDEDAVKGYNSQNPKPHELTHYQIESLLRNTFVNGNTMTYKPLWEKFKSVLKSELEIDFGDKKCKDLIIFLKENKYLNHNPNLKVYTANMPPK